MLELSDGMLLYHGSYCEVRTPDLEDQFCFRTDEGLKCLSFVESEQIWKN